MKAIVFRKFKLIIISLLLILITKKCYLAEEIFISATKEGISKNFLPSNIMLISSEDIKNMISADNLSEVIDKLSVYEVGHYGLKGTQGLIRLRNSTAQQVLVLLNGFPLNGACQDSFNLSLIPANVIDRIEVLPGSFSGIYGANAVAGVINVVTKDAKINKPTIGIFSNYGDFNTYSVKTDFEYNTVNYSASLFTEFKHSDGHRENSKYDSLSGYVNLSLPTLYGKFVLNILNNKSDLGIIGPTYMPTPFAKQTDFVNLQSLSYEGKIFHSKVVYNTKNLIYDNSKDQFWPEKSDSEIKTVSFLNTVKVPYEFFLLLNYRYTQIEQRYPLNITYNFNKDVSNIEFALQRTLKTSKLSLIPTVRFDINSIFGNKFSPQIMFTYNIYKTKFSLSAGTSWRTPTFLDLYWPDQMWSKGNPKLKPEESYSLDFAFENRFSNSLNFVINPFYRYIKHQIRWYPEDPNNMWSAWTPFNFDEAITVGLETKLEFDILRVINNKIMLLISDNKIKKAGELQKGWQAQAYSPLFSISYLLSTKLPYGFYMTSVAKYTDEQYSGDGKTGQKLKDFVLWDLKLQKSIKDIFYFYVSVKDLLNQKGVNRIGYTMPGTVYEVGINFRIKM
ncbi:MAG: TonB-dependent receptor [Endomicrobia bacterium]|nr:TonB-dependent receptor [Endomicrobiia bacterium]